MKTCIAIALMCAGSSWADDSKPASNFVQVESAADHVVIEHPANLAQVDPTAFSNSAACAIELVDSPNTEQKTMAESRNKLNPKLRSYVDALSTTLDRVEPERRKQVESLADWIAANYRPGQPLHVVVVCTGNSRRSILGSSMGNLAAVYQGMPEIRFHSGGTAPSAFNPRTIAALQAVGFEIEPTGQEAPRGEPKTANPVYQVSWGNGFEMMEFSKRYSDASNPREGFAAVMVCSEADEGCPLVQGAAVRISMPFSDPKSYDGSALETAKYAERRDEIGRAMLFVMQRARERVDSKSKQNP